MSELVQLMQSKLTSEDTAYTAKYMKQKLLVPNKGQCLYEIKH